MKTNKRTVWFLTLLSLVAVISIYYMKGKAPMSFDGIQLFTDEITETVNVTDNAKDETTPVFAKSYLFDEMRMEVSNQRSKLKEQLESKMTSSEYTAEEKNKAYDEMANLTKLESTEALMELEIKAMGYPEAFVRTEDGKVKVTVLSTEGHSTTMAEEIVRYIKTNWEEARTVMVDFTGGQ